MIKYPYPVLAPDGSSYKDNISYELSFVRNTTVHESIIFEFDVKMNSEYLKSLMDKSQAKMYVRIQTSIFVELKEIDGFASNIKCTVLTENIAANDIIRFTGYIVSTADIILPHSEEFLDIYPQDYTVALKKNDTLAVSNEESLSYNSSNNDFIRFQLLEEQNGKGFYVGYETNYIVVYVGTEFNRAYGIVKNNYRDVCTMFDSHLVFEVFLCVLVDLIQDFDEYKDLEWFKLFEQIYMQVSDVSFDDFVVNVKDGNHIEMEEVFKMAHKLSNNQIENSLISLCKSEER